MRTMTRLGLLVAIALVAAACGGGGDDTPTTTTSSSTTSTSTTTSTTTGPTTTTSPASTTTKPAQATTCLVSQLSAQFGQVDAGAGQRNVKLVFTNNSQQPCTMLGFPGFQLKGQGGSNVPTNVVRTQNTPKTLITILPNGQAFTTLHWGAIPGQGDNQNGACQPNPTTILITPPNETHSLTQPWTFGSVCEQGTLDVNAMVLGSGN